MKTMNVKRKIRDETTPAVMAGETIRFTKVPSFDLETSNRGSFSTVVLNPSNGTSLRLSETLPSSSSDCLEACLVQNTWSGGLVPLSCGTASLVRSSPIAMTTCDMSMYLSPGDFVRAGTRVTPVAEVTSTSFVMTVRHDEASQSGVRVSKQREVAPLSGSVNVTVGSSRVYASFDLRDEVFPNDVVKLLGSKNKYTVISPITKNYISLARNLTHDDAENSSVTLLKVLPLMIEGGVPLSGLCTAQNGARSMYVTTDLRADLDKGDTIAVDTFRALVLEVGPSKIDLDRPYDLNSASGLVLYKVETPSSMKDLLGLEHGLADCDTLYCMAMKELGMSGVSFDLFQRDDDEEKEDHAVENTTNTTAKPISGLDDDDKETSEMDEKMRRLRKIMQKGGIDAVEGADDVLRSIAESKTLGEIPDPDAVLPGSEDVASDDLPTSNSDTYVWVSLRIHSNTHTHTHNNNRFNEWLDEKNAGEKSSTGRQLPAPQAGSDADLRSKARRAGIGKGEIRVVRDKNGDAGFHYDSKTLKITKLNDRDGCWNCDWEKDLDPWTVLMCVILVHYKKLAKGKNEFVLRLVF